MSNVEVHNINVKGKHYAFIDIPALPAARILMKIQKLGGAVFSDATVNMAKNLSKKTKKGESVNLDDFLDSDFNSMIKTITDNLNEEIITDIIIPLFGACDLKGGIDKGPITTEEQINFVFPNVNGIIELIDIIKQISEVQFGDFLPQLLNHFGFLKRNEDQQKEKNQDSPSRKLAN